MEEMRELLAQLVGTLTDKDLNDPTMAALLAQFLHIIEPQPVEISEDLQQQLEQIQNKAERFKQAALTLGIKDPSKFKELVDALRQVNLLNAVQR